jgi:hypothetical protein
MKWRDVIKLKKGDRVSVRDKWRWKGTETAIVIERHGEATKRPHGAMYFTLLIAGYGLDRVRYQNLVKCG